MISNAKFPVMLLVLSSLVILPACTGAEDESGGHSIAEFREKSRVSLDELSREPIEGIAALPFRGANPRDTSLSHLVMSGWETDRALYLPGIEALAPGEARRLGELPLEVLWLPDVSEMTPAVARELQARHVLLPGLKDVDVSLAQALADTPSRKLDLSAVESLEDEVILALAEWPGQQLILDGLRELSPDSASTLIDMPGLIDLSLRGLRSLDAETAAALGGMAPKDRAVMRRGGYGVPRLLVGTDAELSEQVLESLSRAKVATLGVSRLERLGPEEARVLSGFRGVSLLLDGLKEAEPKAFEQLADWEGAYLVIAFDGAITALQARSLAEWRGPMLELRGVGELTQEVTRALAEREGDTALMISGIRGFDVAVAAPFAAYEGRDLVLELDELPIGAAESLASNKVEHLRIDGIEALSPDTAEALAAWDGRELILGISRLDEKTASALAAWPGRQLSLPRLEHVGAAEAAALARWDAGGRLLLPRLRHLDVEAAEALAMWETQEAQQVLDLRGIRSLDQAASQALAAWKGDVLYLGSPDRFDASVIEALQEFAGELILTDTNAGHQMRR